MTVYVRRFPCSVCGKNVYYDDEKQKLTCGCGSFKATFVNLQEFLALPKKRSNMKCPRCHADLNVKKLVDEFNDAEVLILECPRCGWEKRYVDI